MLLLWRHWHGALRGVLLLGLLGGFFSRVHSILLHLRLFRGTSCCRLWQRLRVACWRWERLIGASATAVALLASGLRCCGFSVIDSTLLHGSLAERPFRLFGLHVCLHLLVLTLQILEQMLRAMMLILR